MDHWVHIEDYNLTGALQLKPAGECLVLYSVSVSILYREMRLLQGDALGSYPSFTIALIPANLWIHLTSLRFWLSFLLLFRHQPQS